jgi:hypothetical protein
MIKILRFGFFGMLNDFVHAVNEWALHLCYVLDKLCLAQVAQCVESEKGGEKKWKKV